MIATPPGGRPLTWGLLGVVPVAVGALAWLPGLRLPLDGLRAVAAGAALAVVLGALLPEAIHTGVVGVGAFLVGLLAPVLAERLTQARGEAGIAAVALAAHQLLDGLQLGALGNQLGPAGALALGFHGAPLVAAATLTAADHHRRAGLLGLMLVGVTALGVLVASAVPGPWRGEHGWLAALVGGVLLHVVVHFVVHALRGPYRPAGAVVTFLVLTWF